MLSQSTSLVGRPALHARVKAFAEKHRLAIAIVVTLGFILGHVPFILNHEVWYDEVVPWQLSKQITPVNYYELNSTEPHPPLWQFILAPFSQLGAPIEILNFISLAFVAAAIFLLWWKSPFGLIPRLALSFSILFCYHNPVIARDYSMAPLATMLVCLAFKSRLEKPGRYGLALAFLVQTHFLMWGLVATLSVEFVISFIENKLKSREKISFRNFAGVASFAPPLALSVVVCVPAILGCLTNHMIVTGTSKSVQAPLDFFSYLNSAAFGFPSVIFETCVCLILLYLLLNDVKWFLVSGLSLGSMYLMMIFFYNGYSHLEQKTSLFFAALFAIFWIVAYALRPDDSSKTADKPNHAKRAFRKAAGLLDHLEIVRVLRHCCPRFSVVALFCLPFILTIPHTFAMAANDLAGNYDDSRDIAEILNAYPENSIFVLEDSIFQTIFTAVSPFLEDNRRFYDSLYDRLDINLAYDNDFYTRMTIGISDPKLKQILNDLSKTYDHIYYIAQKPTCGAASAAHHDVVKEFDSREYETSYYVSTENFTTRFYIYEIKNEISFTREEEKILKIENALAVDSIPRLDIKSETELSTSKDTWTEHVQISISDERGSPLVAEAKVRPRGTSSYRIGLETGAMPYKIKFTEKQDLLGRGANKNYVLVPTMIDPSGVRNFLAYKIGGLIMDENWTPEVRLVEVFVNGKYQGLYDLVESIEADETRANIKQKQNSFIVEFDMQSQAEKLYSGEIERTAEAFNIPLKIPMISFGHYKTSETVNVTFELKYPDSFAETTEEHGDLIVQTMADVYQKIHDHAPLSEIPIDLASFAKFYLVMDLFYNYGAYSSLYYTYDGEKVHAGPIWDYDRALSNFSTRHFLYTFTEDSERDQLYDNLFKYPEFQQAINSEFERFYREIAPTFKTALVRLRNNSQLSKAWQRNENLYHRLSNPNILNSIYKIDGANVAIELRRSYQTQLDYIIGFLFDGLAENGDNAELDQPGRIEWMHANLDSWQDAHKKS